jgi:hypothetical protein
MHISGREVQHQQGKLKIGVAKKIIANGKLLNIKTGEMDARFVQWKKYIRTHEVPNVHASPTSENVKSVGEYAVGVEFEDERMDDESDEGESDDETSISDATMDDGEDDCDHKDGKVVSDLL